MEEFVHRTAGDATSVSELGALRPVTTGTARLSWSYNPGIKQTLQ